MNSVFAISSPSDLLHINQIEIEADTIQSHVAEADQLSGHIDEFMDTEDAWWDDVLIAQMIELAKRTGNIQRNPVKLKNETYKQENFYTSHFGGMYVFRDADTPTVIAREQVEGLDTMNVDQILTFDDPTAIADFLRDEGLSQLIVQTPNQSTASIIKQKIDFITITTAAENGQDLTGLTRQNIRMLERKFANKMPEEFYGLVDVWRWASMGGAAPKIGPEHPAFFYALKSSQHKDRALVNMLLSDLSRLDLKTRRPRHASKQRRKNLSKVRGASPMSKVGRLVGKKKTSRIFGKTIKITAKRRIKRRRKRGIKILSLSLRF